MYISAHVHKEKVENWKNVFNLGYLYTKKDLSCLISFLTLLSGVQDFSHETTEKLKESWETVLHLQTAELKKENERF